MEVIKHKSMFPSLFDDDMGNLFQGFLRPLKEVPNKTVKIEIK